MTLLTEKAAAGLPMIVANWKMYGSRDSLTSWLAELAAAGMPGGIEMVLLPPFVLLPAAQARCPDGLMLGAQTLGPDPGKGAFTGEISAEMLNECGCHYVLAGHSERRIAGETEEAVASRVAAAFAAGLTPILCVGENKAERSEGAALSVVCRQLAAGLSLSGSAVADQSLVLAYEPVWAIGSGKTPSVADIAEVHSKLRQELTVLFGDKIPPVRILYGGSVNEHNAADFASHPQLDGLLVGRASLDARQLMAIAVTFA